jgi:hypothetical protein
VFYPEKEEGVRRPFLAGKRSVVRLETSRFIKELSAGLVDAPMRHLPSNSAISRSELTMKILDKIFGGQSDTHRVARPPLACNKCGSAQPGYLLALCPTCQEAFCPKCAELSEFVLYRPEDPQNGSPKLIETMAFRCPNDHVLLRKEHREPFVEALRALEQEDWCRSTIDPRNEIANWLNDTTARLARRFIAIGMTFHPNPTITFGLLGAAIRLCSAYDAQSANSSAPRRDAVRRALKDADDYLVQCSRDFGNLRFPLELARSLLQGYVMACTENPHVHIALAVGGFIVARQFLRKGSAGEA